MKKMKISLVFVSIISVVFVLNLLAQTVDDDLLNRIHTQLSSTDMNTIKKANNLLKGADNKLKLVEKEEEKFEKYFPKKAKKGEKKALKAKTLRIEAADLRAKAYNAKYRVYKRKIEGVTFEYPNDEERAKELIKEADASINSGSKKLKSYMGIKKSDLKKKQYAKIQKDLAKVLELQQFAIDRVAEAFEIWFQQDEKKMKEMAEKDAWSTAQSRNTANSFRAYLTQYPYGDHASAAKIKIGELEENQKLADEDAERKRREEEALKNKKETGIWFEVQVMAVTKQAPEKTVTKVYKGSDNVREFQNDGWFKYSVGKFKTYKEARAYRSQTGVRGAFVVAFQDEQPIKVRDAKKILKANRN